MPPVAVLLLAAIPIILCQGQDFSNGFNSKLDWITPATLQAMDLKTNDKPILYLFNQPWCGACNKLKENFQLEGDKLLSLSKKFLMVNVGGDDNNLFGGEYAPDGGYIPRILFAEPDGKLRADAKNPGNPDQYSYFYPTVEAVQTGMQNALKLLEGSRLADGDRTESSSEL